MPSFPHPGSHTICEINRDLSNLTCSHSPTFAILASDDDAWSFAVTAEELSDDRAWETYGKLLGMVFSPVQFQAVQVKPEGREEEGVEGKGFIVALQGILNNFLKPFLHPNDVALLQEIDLQGVAWHDHKHILAFVSGPGQVTVHDYERNEPSILDGGLLPDVRVIEWRPNGATTLAMGCRGAVCMFAASYPGNEPFVSSLIAEAPYEGRHSIVSGDRWIVVDILPSHSREAITALSWSPDGRYLATGSFKISSFSIWDVTRGVCVQRGRGSEGISIMKWSPTGDYFFAAKFDGTFYLWETNMWTSVQWSSNSGFVTGATWDPEGRMILIAFHKSSTLGSIHFASKPPSLDAHLSPVDLPELTFLTGSQGIEKIAWDSSGERLAVSFEGGDDLYKGLIAVFDARRTPLVSASLIGFIRGPGENPKPLAFSFHNKFKQGPLLSVSWSSGYCCTYPLICRSHVLP